METSVGKVHFSTDNLKGGNRVKGMAKLTKVKLRAEGL